MKNSKRPRSIQKREKSLDPMGRKAKESVGPAARKAAPTLLRKQATRPSDVSGSMPSKIKQTVPSSAKNAMMQKKERTVCALLSSTGVFPMRRSRTVSGL